MVCKSKEIITFSAWEIKAKWNIVLVFSLDPRTSRVSHVGPMGEDLRESATSTYAQLQQDSPAVLSAAFHWRLYKPVCIWIILQLTLSIHTHSMNVQNLTRIWWPSESLSTSASWVPLSKVRGVDEPPLWSLRVSALPLICGQHNNVCRESLEFPAHGRAANLFLENTAVFHSDHLLFGVLTSHKAESKPPRSDCLEYLCLSLTPASQDEVLCHSPLAFPWALGRSKAAHQFKRSQVVLAPGSPLP